MNSKRMELLIKKDLLKKQLQDEMTKKLTAHAAIEGWDKRYNEGRAGYVNTFKKFEAYEAATQKELDLIKASLDKLDEEEDEDEVVIELYNNKDDDGEGQEQYGESDASLSSPNSDSEEDDEQEEDEDSDDEEENDDEDTSEDDDEEQLPLIIRNDYRTEMKSEKLIKAINEWAPYIMYVYDMDTRRNGYLTISELTHQLVLNALFTLPRGSHQRLTEEDVLKRLNDDLVKEKIQIEHPYEDFKWDTL